MCFVLHLRSSSLCRRTILPITLSATSSINFNISAELLAFLQKVYIISIVRRTSFESRTRSRFYIPKEYLKMKFTVAASLAILSTVAAFSPNSIKSLSSVTSVASTNSNILRPMVASQEVDVNTPVTQRKKTKEVSAITFIFISSITRI